MRFGVFDHMDRNGLDVGAQYRDRLALIEAYDEAGFYAYHIAEHHGTPLGLASSPSVFLAAVSQRTERLRFGPLVYTLSIYHPLRAIEEVCMLDQLSGGRLELGVGRGISPIEMGFFGDIEHSQSVFEEVKEILLLGLSSERLNYAGKHFTFTDVPIELKPVQRPHPPLWYGVAQAARAAWAAEHGMNIVTNGPAAAVRQITDEFKRAWASSTRAGQPVPRLGMSRHIVVAATDQQARNAAAPAYARWFDSLLHLWRVHDIPIPLSFPENLDDACAAGLAVVGSAATVRDTLDQQVRESGVNYLLCRLAFGNLAQDVSMASTTLMRNEIMPALANIHAD